MTAVSDTETIAATSFRKRITLNNYIRNAFSIREYKVVIPI